MRRRGPGIAGIQRAKRQETVIKQVGAEMEEVEVASMTKQMEVFKSQLEIFATKHKKDIRKNPQFRAQFQQMCVQVGVDPLNSKKGFWSELLGVGDFYFELGVQIVEVCLASQKRNGGLMEMDDVMKSLKKVRPRNAPEVSQDDCERAVKTLKNLGKGFDFLKVGNDSLIQSIPAELNKDHQAVFKLAMESGFVTLSQMIKELKWTKLQATKCLEFLLKETLVWQDDQSGAETTYWFPFLLGRAT
ncbi:vacuolar-sorting protein SNF8 [Sphaeroforma arctica JP610]|uniref:Vacuolar-sorting protein SNF8 n=1 Tax=Sphaeroforma arctica JP610 TaxID=667725 RepID=A0A0L0G2G0_9EUKA|nr:vacuolar-sorting protein SNF8 [Sphaeroforma arctica JP610]KNC83322.1 vacuolar-sorting protein SNF8 [Sphaeroforma arctica JP610]|eukprot:XP_014157224.1 vacuolar-sorting protein SNF8 [Sphaeroforma arctica JP610]